MFPLGAPGSPGFAAGRGRRTGDLPRTVRRSPPEATRADPVDSLRPWLAGTPSSSASCSG